MAQLQRRPDAHRGRRGALLPGLRGARVQRHPQHCHQQFSGGQQPPGRRATRVTHDTGDDVHAVTGL